MNTILSFLQNFLAVFMESAPWLLLGLLVAGIIKAFIPPALLAKHLGKNNAVSVIKAALFGAPLPLCSCGVIPAALGLYRSGASKAATTSFLISTPETGVDSISISYALLGPFIAIIRPIAAVVTAISAGLLVILFGNTHKKDVPRGTSSAQAQATQALENNTSNNTNTSTNTSCCASKSTAANTTNNSNNSNSTHKHKHTTSSCCDSNTGATGNSSSKNNSNDIQNEKNASCCSKNNNSKHSIENKPTFLQKLSEGLSFTLVKLVKDISLWLLLGLAAAALILTLVPSSFLATWGSSIFAFFIMAAIGIPMYICATASTPIAAGLLFAGVSPGAVLVFLLVGPATNLATMGMVKQELGKKVLAIYLATVVGMGFLFGYITNLATDYFHIDFSKQVAHAHIHQNINYAASVILSLLILNALYKKYIAKS